MIIIPRKPLKTPKVTAITAHSLTNSIAWSPQPLQTSITPKTNETNISPYSKKPQVEPLLPTLPETWTNIRKLKVSKLSYGMRSTKLTKTSKKPKPHSILMPGLTLSLRSF
ncbi:uncharacterized protein PHALS_09674 [Plasmopara halstedii]|uniref:Uncharacterized protein n=1 Tax=Plasmopara halstedii TaxID=4781 RepID=A0A0N7L4R7_PLAHL|nr:uncharacterized protein PHALS_09674 [Plasmopara halstedii]CEG39427.1 hypothetical protein PHALS_09674 [Plasmopara halstedii]|eukprot:XP_024575796.1 hypothetical protein PHALS_09674 [Plasmopara halstedii]